MACRGQLCKTIAFLSVRMSARFCVLHSLHYHFSCIQCASCPGHVCVKEHHSLRHMHWEQVKRTSLSDNHGDMTFGYKRPPDAEGAGISACPPNKGFNLHYTLQPRHLNLMHLGKSCSWRLSEGVMSDDLLAVIRSWAQTNKTVQQDSGPDYLRMNKLAALRLLSGFTPRPTCIAEASS